jgi:hypothetical protein
LATLGDCGFIPKSSHKVPTALFSCVDPLLNPTGTIFSPLGGEVMGHPVADEKQGSSLPEEH